MPISPTQSSHPLTLPATTTAHRDHEEVVAYLELNAKHAFAVAYALTTHCRRVGPPTTALQHEVAGLRDFLLAVLDEQQVEVLLDSI